MKLIIDIPKEVYKASQIIDVKYEDVIQIPLEVIKNGNPLDDIKKEIFKLIDNTDSVYGTSALYKALEIIDRIGKESEDKNDITGM